MPRQALLVAVAAAVLCATTATAISTTGAAASTTPLNVLMIAIDDLRTEISAYLEGAHMHTPHMQALAQDSVVFERAYVQVALCSPSRTALLTSRRADTTRVWIISPEQYWRNRGCNATTLPQTFKEGGYGTVAGAGKIFHDGAPSGDQDACCSWSPESTPVPTPAAGANCSDVAKLPGNAVVEANCTREQMQDGQTATLTVNTLHRVARDIDPETGKPKPWFVAAGFRRPHIPWNAPKEYFSLYPNASVTLPPLMHNGIGVPNVALQGTMAGWSGAARGGKHAGWPQLGEAFGAQLNASYPEDNATIPDDWTRRLRQAYWATTSMTDDNVGEVIAALKGTGMYNDTLIVLWGDHGYMLQDHNQWAKQSNYEHATRIPLFVKAPGFAPGRSSALVEEVDIMPTLIELAMGRRMPACSHDVSVSRATAWCTEGFSMVPLLQSASSRAGDDNEAPPQWKRAAFSQYQRDGGKVMGYSIRVHDYRYTAWVGFNTTTATPDWGDVHGVELYDHSDSPVPSSWDMEGRNVAGVPAYASTQKSLHAQLVAGWRAAGPPLSSEP